MAARKTPPNAPDSATSRIEEGSALGLCALCRHHLAQGTKRGAVFHRCGLADEDDRFMRYPPMPVAACPGFAEQEPGD